MIQQDNMFDDGKQGLKTESIYYTGILEQFEDEEALYEEDISTETEGPKTDQYDSEDSSDVFIGPDTEEDFMRL